MTLTPYLRRHTIADIAAALPKNMENSLVDPSLMRTHTALLITSAYDDACTLSIVCATALHAAADGHIAIGSNARPPSHTCSTPLQNPTVKPPGSHSQAKDSTSATSWGRRMRSWNDLGGAVEVELPGMTTLLTWEGGCVWVCAAVCVCVCVCVCACVRACVRIHTPPPPRLTISVSSAPNSVPLFRPPPSPCPSPATFTPATAHAAIELPPPLLVLGREEVAASDRALLSL